MIIVDYMVIAEQAKDQLERSVRRAISIGWQPFGNFVVHNSPKGIVTFAQPMVRYK